MNDRKFPTNVSFGHTNLLFGKLREEESTFTCLPFVVPAVFISIILPHNSYLTTVVFPGVILLRGVLNFWV